MATAVENDANAPEPESERLNSEKRFTEQLFSLDEESTPAESRLWADDRVLARITDGIYRNPSSALRELISNAYDADATEVHVETDAPNFTRITVWDNGIGMDERSLSRLVHHIGGSSKRTAEGVEIGTTSAQNASLTKGGRRLIGKIGIGLFSVNQLTQRFQIITKIKGKPYRLLAEVVLNQYEEKEEEVPPEERAFDPGSVKVIRIPADDLDAQGTEVILTHIRPRARNILRSQARWEQLQLEGKDRDPEATAPSFHIGYVRDVSGRDREALYVYREQLPWSSEDPPEVRMQRLYDGVANLVGELKLSETPELNKVLDTYLETIWSLGLAAPVPYMEKHPFQHSAEDDIEALLLNNAGGTRAQPLDISVQTVASAAGLDQNSGVSQNFRVIFDGVELRRPISFRYWPRKNQAIKHPLLFVGSYEPDLSKIPPQFRGGALRFDAYFFWNSRIVPKENNGVLVRINNAGGALFDDTFMKYKVSEQTRLGQLTAEIYVHRGLDAALNIDRESFNFAHPHYQILSSWVHRCLRQIATTLKAISKSLREKEQDDKKKAERSRVSSFASEVWTAERHEEVERPPEVDLVQTAEDVVFQRRLGSLAFDPGLFAHFKLGGDDASRVEQFKALALILDAYGLLSKMSVERQHQLLDAIMNIFHQDAANG